ncbi:AbfB domain-containing protein, partial [Micromonospora sp. I033]
RVSLEAANEAGAYVSTRSAEGVLVTAGPGSAGAVRREATFEMVEGLANARCYSFRYADGRYLRHSSWRLRLDRNVGTPLFLGDATFCARPGTRNGTIELESANYPGWFLRHRDDQLWVDQSDGTAAFRADSAFRVRPPLAG